MYVAHQIRLKKRWEIAGQHEISSHDSEGVRFKTQELLFLEFLFNICGPLWTRVTETVESLALDGGSYSIMFRK